MDLETIKKKLESNHYHSAKDCIEHFDLMFGNCYSYNKAGEVRRLWLNLHYILCFMYVELEINPFVLPNL